MKLDAETLTYIQTVINTAQLVGIDGIIIEQGLVRAIDDDKTVVIFQNENVHELAFGNLGLNRVALFMSRFDIIRNREDASIEVTVDDDREYARSLIMRSKGIKIDYRCANPVTIQAPRQINDTMKFQVPLNGEAVFLLNKGQAAMGAETVSIISNADGVAFELQDINNDIFSHVFTSTDSVKCLDDSKPTFAHRYPVKTLLQIFKTNAEGDFFIGNKGMLKFVVNGLDMYVIPRV